MASEGRLWRERAEVLRGRRRGRGRAGLLMGEREADVGEDRAHDYWALRKWNCLTGSRRESKIRAPRYRRCRFPVASKRGEDGTRRCDMMPTVAVCVYCSHKIEEKAKSVNVPICRAALPTWRAPRR